MTKDPKMKTEDWNPEHTAMGMSEDEQKVMQRSLMASTVRVVGPGGEVSAREAELMERIAGLEDISTQWKQQVVTLRGEMLVQDERIEELKDEAVRARRRYNTMDLKHQNRIKELERIAAEKAVIKAQVIDRLTQTIKDLEEKLVPGDECVHHWIDSGDRLRGRRVVRCYYCAEIEDPENVSQRIDMDSWGPA